MSKAPPAIAQLIGRVAASLIAGGGLIAAALALSQSPFASGEFEYGVFRPHIGVLREAPYPTLDEFLLVAPGKHGASGIVQGLDGRKVALEASLIRRGDTRMLEVRPGSVRALQAAAVASWRDAGEAQFQGEIVDSKCYLGVMNPGNGKVHRDCAARCISGGVPPALVVRQADGSRQVYLLAGPDGRALPGSALMDYIAEPVSIRGRLRRSGAVAVIDADLTTLHRE